MNYYSPLYAAIIAGIFTFLYLTIQSISPNLPPAILISIVVANVAYQYQRNCPVVVKENFNF
jgi:hypothetical protein